jgi:prophage regulatory protein
VPSDQPGALAFFVGRIAPKFPRSDKVPKHDNTIDNLSGETAPERLLRLKEVRSLTGLGASTIYRLISEHRFPKQLHPLGNKIAAWRASEVSAWIAARAAGRAA